MKIAFFTYDWNNEIVSDFCTGIESFLHAHPDVCVHLFDGFGKYGIDEAQQGDFQIFTLPDFADYDGLVIQGNRAWKPALRQKIADAAGQYGIPVVSMNYSLDGCINVSNDNYGAMKEMCAHVIEVHQAKSLVFVKGLHTSMEAQARLRGFVDCCHEHGIDSFVTMDASWAEEDDMRAAREIVDLRKLPDAVICANDDLAYGVIREFQRKGISVPDDVIVTGFDHLSIADACEPRITTMNRNYVGISETALQCLYEKMRSCTVDNTVYVRSQLVKAGSCGCGNRFEEYADMKEKYSALNRHVKTFYRYYDLMKHELELARSIDEIAGIVERNIANMSQGNMYLVINGDYYDAFCHTGNVKQYGEKMYLMGVSDGNKHVCDEKHIYDTFNRRQILPDRWVQDHAFLRISPLRYDEIVIGYLVEDGIHEFSQINFLEILLSEIDSAIENTHRAIVMDAMNQKLRDLYTKDQQTGLYNRFGLQRFGEAYYNKAMARESDVVISFIDIDHMKSINDMFGHEAGDLAIKMTAEIILTAIAGTDSIAVRYGGDEFVVIGEEDLSERLASAYLAYLKNHDLPFAYSISHGVFVAKNRDGLSLQKAIDQADDLMYTIKKTKHHSESL